MNADLWRAILAALVLGGAAAAEEVERGTLREKQHALTALGDTPGAEADRALRRELERYDAHELPPGLWLELFEAAAKREDPEIRERLAERERMLAAARDPVARWRECLEGGDAKSGRVIFAERPDAGCIRCHRVNDFGGAIGPVLTGLGLFTDRVFILESIVEPNAVIAQGFGHFLLTLKSGESVSGIVNLDGADEVVLTSVTDGKRRTIKAADIAERTPLPSAMPPGLALTLGKRAIRDLVEYIATSQ